MALRSVFVGRGKVMLAESVMKALVDEEIPDGGCAGYAPAVVIRRDEGDVEESWGHGEDGLLRG